jgi:hypothetical protein
MIASIITDYRYEGAVTSMINKRLIGMWKTTSMSDRFFTNYRPPMVTGSLATVVLAILFYSLIDG